jgi:ABC-type antimicrobial peptide transport system permease subunit
MIFKNLWRRKTRTILTLVAVSLGVGAIVAFVAIGNGLVSGFTEIFSGSEADLVLSQADALDPSISVVDESVADEVANLPGVKRVSGMITGNVTTEGIPYFYVFGHDPDGFAIEHFKIVEGEGLTSRSRHEIIIGKIGADSLNRGVGDSIRMYDSAYRIVGVYETGANFEDAGGVITLRDAQAMLKKPHQVNVLHVQLKRVEDVDEVQARIERRFPDLAVSQSGESANKELLMQTVGGFAWGISFLAILIGGVGMMNTMLMSIFERTREIGLLRALGWRRGRVLSMVLMESIGLTVMGGALGAVLGVATVKLFASIPATAGLMQGEFSVSLFVQAFLVALGLGAIGGLYPAWRASGVDPLSAMQYGADRGGGNSSRRWPGGMIVRNLMRRRTRSVLTLVGIGIAIAAIVALGGMAEGLGQQITGMVGGEHMDLLAIEANISDMQYSSIDERVIKRIAAMSEVESVSGFVLGVIATEDTPLGIIYGYNPHEQAISHFRIVEGAGLSSSRQAIIGRLAADGMDKDVGETINLAGSRYRIVGIYETGVPFEDIGIVISLREAQTLLGRPRQVGFLGIRLRNPRQVDVVLAELEERFPEISVSKTAEFTESIPDLRTSDAMVGGIAFLAVLVGGIGMMNTVFMSVFERTREIGVLRALGWRKMRVLGMIIREAMLLGAAGGLAGIVLGVGLGKMLTMIPLLGAVLEPSYSFELMLRAFVLAVVLGTIAGLYPAWWASRLDPLEALRYE